MVATGLLNKDRIRTASLPQPYSALTPSNANHAPSPSSKPLAAPLLPVVPHYSLETQDARHRCAPWLNRKHGEWLKTNRTQDFFSWLDTQPDQTNAKQVVYFNEQERQQCQLVFRDGIAYVNGQRYDTSAFSGKQSGYAMYVVDSAGHIYCHPYKKNCFHHSSLSAGKPVIAAGMIKMVNGKIAEINNYSGHFGTPLENLKAGAHFFSQSAFVENAVIVYRHPYFKQAVSDLKRSAHWFLQLLGGVLDRMVREVEISMPEIFAAETVKIENTATDYNAKPSSYENMLKTFPAVLPVQNITTDTQYPNPQKQTPALKETSPTHTPIPVPVTLFRTPT